MTEVLRPLLPHEHSRFMPMREMNEEHQKEVYKAAGELLATYFENDDPHFVSGGFLVRLESRQLVGFSYGIAEYVSVIEVY